MLISIITPSFNSGDYLERAIESVLIQDYTNYEHIVVDGASTDNTLEILKKYPHIKWISEPDEGQVDAMNKGFAMSKGDVLVYLNADDYFLEGAFSAVMKQFSDDVDMVMGKVRVYSEKDDIWWENDPKTDLDSMLRHWEPNAFCVNPVSYFYRRRVQEAIPFNEENDDKQDLEFLLDVAESFKIAKTDHHLGVFFDNMNAKTFKEQIKLDYWRPDNFSFLDRFLEKKSESYVRKFRELQRAGYHVRTENTINDVFRLGLAEKFCKNGELIQMPTPKDAVGYDKVAESRNLLGPNNTVVIILTFDSVGSDAITSVIRGLGKRYCPYPIYQVHGLSDDVLDKYFWEGDYAPHKVVSAALNVAIKEYGDKVRFKVITTVGDPVQHSLFRGRGEKALDVSTSAEQTLGLFEEHVTREIQEFFGVSPFEGFDPYQGYGITRNKNVEVLTLRLDKYSEVMPMALEEFFGVENVAIKPITFERLCAESPSKGSDILNRKAVHNIFTSKYMRRFFSREEIRSLISKWSSFVGLPTFKRVLAPRYFCVNDAKMAYLSIPKNACTTLKFALAARGDEQKLSLIRDASKIHTEANSLFDSIVDVSDGLPDGYYSFTFVRNPFDRFLSFYKNKILLGWDANMEDYMLANGFKHKMPMDECLKRIRDIDVFSMNEHFAPQSAFVFTDGVSNVDYIGRLENIKKDVKHLEKIANFNFLLPKINVTSNQVDINVTDEVIELIRDIYSDDFKLLEYSKEYTAQ